MATIKTSDFFSVPRSQSEIKSEILNEYFKAWAAILLIALNKRFQNKIQSLSYIDLFSGQGYYENGDPSTPIKILNSIQAEPLFNQKVKTFFNDNDSSLATQLEQNIKSLPYYNQLTHKPVILNKEADRDLLARFLNSNSSSSPSLTFIDPFGYKGVSAELCKLAVKNWGSDLFMLFNFNRIRSGIRNSTVTHLMHELFGNKLETILSQYDSMNKIEREDFILNQFISHFTDKGYKALKFKVEFNDKNATSHYLLFVSKVDIAYFKMKEIMAKYSDYQPDGVPWMAVNNSQTQNLFSDFSLVKLKYELEKNSSEFSGLRVEQIYQIHSFDTPYIKENYKTAFSELREEGKVEFSDKNGVHKNRVAYTYTAKFLIS